MEVITVLEGLLDEVRRNNLLIMLNFVGLYFLLLASLIYNFYQSKKMYSLLGTMGEVVAHMGEMRQDISNQKKAIGTMETGGKPEGTVKRLLREGMEMEGREE